MKNILKIVVGAICFIAWVGCGSSDEQLGAQIFERKEVDSSRLMIKYRYVYAEKSYEDSVTIDNQVIDSDSIFVKINRSNPARSVPALTKKQ